ncbi:L-glyceraldehyde 3-phosphate reductase [Cytophagaceae bacterium DM2B3-1]|uniref:L-glyceraldehyde 3-phosphate reductase n=1 Tax=Xanthocytophaga flava TaxID=3048013 RepID=A0ABT7CFN3_9BACT|nr:L-glyceraldehyde 3-phosphate reductase [Xanthocytophaga flavus]MDJ1466555.1 L-glyceraldehyde 3-phosphate reductase [Xanthocytophaga flavus]MDJ1492553.1 L-glyceraldehyde 3-phosphate reductase [Xanthocytophaga flavus]
MAYTPSSARYQSMPYKRCGTSGLLLPAVSLGLWQNFGDVDDFANATAMITHAFDLGITHFDLANNYGPSPGSAEINFGKILKNELAGYRDELIISSKAGYTMWDGPYGDWGSRKYLISSLDQSLKRMGLEYVDIFYSHRYDPNTPLEETIMALDQVVRQGKALYVGISNYGPAHTQRAIDILKQLGTPLLIHQPKYSMFERTPEKGLLDVLGQNGVGCIPFSPLAQGLLTNKYLKGIPEHSRATRAVSLKPEFITDEKIAKVQRLNELAVKRGQTLAQMALAWVLRDNRVTTVLIGASSTKQIDDCVTCLKNLPFSDEELKQIEEILH